MSEVIKYAKNVTQLAINGKVSVFKIDRGKVFFSMLNFGKKKIFVFSFERLIMKINIQLEYENQIRIWI